MIIAKDGKNFVSVQYDPGSNETILFAVEELKKYLTKITSAEFDKSGCKPAQGSIKLCVDPELAKENLEKFCLSCKGQILNITGATPRAVLYGVYEFLERLGCRWVYPFEEVVPTIKRLEVQPFTFSSQPVFPWRALFFSRITPDKMALNYAIISWMAKNRVNMIHLHPGHYRDNFGKDYIDWENTCKRLLPEIRKRAIMVNMNIHHSFYFMPPEKYFAKHPEWYSLLFGTRAPSQICYSNKEAVRTYADNIVRYLRKHPEVDVIGLWPMDGVGFCHCTKCRPADTIFKACMWVAEYLLKKGIKIPVEHLVYTNYSPIWPTEKMKAQKNVVFLVCRKGDYYKMWSYFAQNHKCVGIYQFDYDFADNYAWQGTAPHSPRDVEHAIREITVPYSLGSAPLLMDSDSWWRGCFTLYFYYRLLWYGARSVEPFLEDYCQTYYGRFANDIKKVIKLIDSIYPTRYSEYKLKLQEMRGTMRKVDSILSRVMKSARDSRLKEMIQKYCTYADFVRYQIETKISIREAEEAINKKKPALALKWIQNAKQSDQKALALSRKSKLTRDGVVDICYFNQWHNGPPEPCCYNRQTVYEQLEYRAHNLYEKPI